MVVLDAMVTLFAEGFLDFHVVKLIAMYFLEMHFSISWYDDMIIGIVAYCYVFSFNEFAAERPLIGHSTMICDIRFHIFPLHWMDKISTCLICGSYSKLQVWVEFNPNSCLTYSGGNTGLCQHLDNVCRDVLNCVYPFLNIWHMVATHTIHEYIIPIVRYAKSHCWKINIPCLISLV